MKEFHYKIDNKEYLLNGILLKEFKDLQLLLQINDNTQILDYFNYLNNHINVNIFDQIKLLIYNLIITTRNNYEFTLANENNKIKYSILLEDILKNINSIKIENYKIDINENSYVIIGIPYEFFIYNEETLQQDLLNYNTYSYINKIVIDDEDVPLHHEIIDQLPSIVLSKISQKIHEWDMILKKIPFFNENIEANCQIVTIFEFLKKLFLYDYGDLLRKEYTLFKYIKICNYEYITLNEANALLDIYNEDLQAQQEEIEKSTQNTSGINIPSKINNEV